MSVVQPGGADVPEIPNGLYPAVIKAVQDITLDKPDNFGKTEKVKITVSFVDADGIPQTLDPQVNRSWGEKANLFHIAMACGCDADPDLPFETQDLLNKRVNILVEQDMEIKPDGTEKLKWPRIKSWGRIRQRQGAEPAPTPSASPALPEGAPSILTPDANVNWTAFWAATKRMGMTRESVAAQWNGDLGTLEKADPIEVAEWMQITWEAAQASPA